MEVHHHGHVHHQKKWKEYLFQFLMLFLAVFCGFLAEYQLEHKIEKDRAKVYAANFYQELKKDTSALNELIEGVSIVNGKLDSFCLYSREKIKRKATNGMLYYYSSWTTMISFFSSNNTTIDQLKGSGNLRLMDNEVTQKIGEYSKKISQLENEYQLTKSEFGKIEELYFKIFDGYLIVLHEKLSRDSVFKLNLSLINEDPKLMKEFTGWLKFEIEIFKKQDIKHYRPLKKVAEELLVLLKRKYHLE